MRDKKTMRHIMLEKLKNLSPHDREIFDISLLKQLTASDLWKNNNSIGITLANFPEIDTKKIIERAWEEGKQVCIPYSGENRKLSFYAYTPDTKLERSRFGIMEPVNRTTEIPKNALELLIIPGLVYNQEGYRIGFGGGYYDRYLADYLGKTCAILYPFQLDEQIDVLVESFDVAIQKLFIASR